MKKVNYGNIQIPGVYSHFKRDNNDISNMYEYCVIGISKPTLANIFDEMNEMSYLIAKNTIDNNTIFISHMKDDNRYYVHNKSIYDGAMVVYRAIYDNRLYVRPAKEWFTNVENREDNCSGQKTRFELI